MISPEKGPPVTDRELVESAALTGEPTRELKLARCARTAFGEHREAGGVRTRLSGLMITALWPVRAKHGPGDRRFTLIHGQFIRQTSSTPYRLARDEHRRCAGRGLSPIRPR